MNRKKIAVIGAGMAGLSCAFELQKKGFDIQVFEKEAEVGGRTRTIWKDGIPLDLGAILLSNGEPKALQLAKTLKVTTHLCTQTKVGFYINGKIEYIESNKKNIIKKIKNQTELIKATLYLIYFLFQRKKFGDSCCLTMGNKETAEEYLLKRIGADLTHGYMDGFSCGTYFQSVDEMDAFAWMNQLYHHALSPKESVSDGYYGLTDGMGSLSNAFSKHLPVKKKSAISKAEAKNGGVVLHGEDGEHFFNATVIAAGARETQMIYKNPTHAQKKLLNEITYGSTVTLYFLAPSSLCTWLGPIYISKNENKKITFISSCQNRGEKTLFSTYLQDSYAKKVISLSDEEIFSLTKESLSTIIPPFQNRLDEIENLLLYRWKDATPKFLPESVPLVDSFWREGQGDQGVYFCGDYLNYPCVEGAIQCGRRVAELIS